MAFPLAAAATYLEAPFAAPVPYAPGAVIAQKYRLERLLGEGAQGSVWLAENLALGSDVALKLVLGEPGNPAPTLRLEREARAAAQIGHAAVVRVFDLGRTPNGDAFIVMEFLEGENLGQRLGARGRLPPIEAVRTLLPIADVLETAHARGIVHRDLKPENVFLAKNAATIQPKLLDFGIAKFREPRRDEHAITQVGALIGSPAYLAPEQALCRPDVGPAADVWSFSVVLYECVTGAVPFAADDYGELFRRIGEEPPPPILAHGVGDLALWEILRRGLEKNPDERWPSMHALGKALARWLHDRGVQEDVSGVLLRSKWLKQESHPARPERVRAPRPLLAARYAMVGAAFAVTAAASLLVSFPRSGPARSSVSAPVEVASSAEPSLVTVRAGTPGAVRTRDREITRRGAPPTRPEVPHAAQPSPLRASEPAALPDGGVPRSAPRKRRVPDDLLNPY